jgi:hypothetical protein
VAPGCGNHTVHESDAVIRIGVVEVPLRAETMAAYEVMEIRLRAGELVTDGTDVASRVAVVAVTDGIEAVS